MGRGMGDILQTLWTLLPTWAVVLLAMTLLVWIVPGYRYRTRAKQVRESVRRIIRADPAGQRAFRDRALDRAGTDPFLLEILVKEARKRSLPELEKTALDRLAAQPKGRALARQLRDEVARQRIDPMHPLEAALRIQTLLDEGVTAAARARLDEALAAHPDDPELLAVRERVVAAESATDAPHPLDAPEE